MIIVAHTESSAQTMLGSIAWSLILTLKGYRTSQRGCTILTFEWPSQLQISNRKKRIRRYQRSKFWHWKSHSQSPWIHDHQYKAPNRPKHLDKNDKVFYITKYSQNQDYKYYIEITENVSWTSRLYLKLVILNQKKFQISLLHQNKIWPNLVILGSGYMVQRYS